MSGNGGETPGDAVPWTPGRDFIPAPISDAHEMGIRDFFMCLGKLKFYIRFFYQFTLYLSLRYDIIYLTSIFAGVPMLNNHKKKMIAPIIITVIMILYYVVYFGFLISLLYGVWRNIFGIIPLVLSGVMIYVCIERIKEIKKGEEDDIGKY